MDQNAFEQMKSRVFAEQNTLRDIYEQYGSMSVYDYVNSWPVGPVSPNLLFVETLRQHLEVYYKADVVQDVIAQFLETSLLSTIDHHGILNHPFFINSNLVYSLRKNTRHMVVLGTAGISLNNSSWPGSLVVTNEKMTLDKYSLFTDKQKHKVVFATSGIGEKELAILLSRIESGNLSVTDKAKITELIQKSFSKEILNLSLFEQQSCNISRSLWHSYFPVAPQVIYLPLEDLVGSLLCKLLEQKDHIMAKLILSSEGWNLVEKYFDGTSGAFTNGHKGSFLFWGLDSQGKRIALFRNGGDIIGGNLLMPLTQSSIIEAVTMRKIYPTSLLCFLVLLYMKVVAIGGFNQVNWLTDIKGQFARLLQELHEEKMASGIAAIPTNNFAEMNLAFLIKNQQLIRASGMDIYLHNDSALYEKYVNLSKTLSLGESIESMLPEIYKIIIPGTERTQEIEQASKSMIFYHPDMPKKIITALN